MDKKGNLQIILSVYTLEIIFLHCSAHKRGKTKLRRPYKQLINAKLRSVPSWQIKLTHPQIINYNRTNHTSQILAIITFELPVLSEIQQVKDYFNYKSISQKQIHESVTAQNKTIQNKDIQNAEHRRNHASLWDLWPKLQIGWPNAMGQAGQKQEGVPQI